MLWLNLVDFSKVTCLSLKGFLVYDRLLLEPDYFSIPTSSYRFVHNIDVEEALEETLVSGEISLKSLIEPWSN